MRIGDFVGTAGVGLLLLAGPAAGQTPPAAAPAAWRRSMTVGGYVQGELDAGAVRDSRFPAADRFFLRRARITVGGAVLPTLTYRIQADLAGGLSAASSVKAALTDGYIEWAPSAAAHVRLGQFKAPFGREWLVSSPQLVTVERTLASDDLTLNRQVGIDVFGSVREGRVGYEASVFNGNGRNTNVNDNGRFLYVIRGTATPWRTARVGRLLVGANVYWSHDSDLSMPAEFGFDSTPETPARDHLFTGRRIGGGVDAHLERGFWRLDGEFLRVRFEQAGHAQPVTSAQGWYATPGAFVYRRLIQVVGRYERFQFDIDAAGSMTTTWLTGVNYYARGTDAKVMVDYLWVTSPDHSDAHQKLLAQVQVVF